MKTVLLLTAITMFSATSAFAWDFTVLGTGSYFGETYGESCNSAVNLAKSDAETQCMNDNGTMVDFQTTPCACQINVMHEYDCSAQVKGYCQKDSDE